MKHWTIGRIFFATAVVAFFAMLSQAEGWGEHRSRISDLQLSPDGSTLAVARSDGRVAFGSYNKYFTDLWLTRSLIRSSDGQVIKTLDLYPVRSWDSGLRNQWVTREFAFSEKNVYLASDEFRLDCWDLNGAKNSSVSLPSGVAKVAVTSDQKFVLCCTTNSNAMLINAKNLEVLWTKNCDCRWGGAIAISGNRFATLDNSFLRWGTLVENTRIVSASIALNDDVDHAHWIHFTKSDSAIIVVRDEHFDLIDLTTEKVQRVPSKLIGLSTDGARLVVQVNEGLQIIDMESGERGPTLPFVASAACLSNDGKTLYLGLEGTRIVCVDALSGKQLWSKSAPGHYRPGMGSLFALAVGVCLACWQYKRRSRRKAEGREPSALAVRTI